MTAFVLVPGAWLGGWCWKAVAGPLRRLGHEVYPVTLTGLGDREHLANPAVNLETHIADVINLLRYEDLRGVTLVGHSYAGAVIAGVSDRAPERLARVVYLDARPLGDGEALFDTLPAQFREQVAHQSAAGGEGWRWPPPPFEEMQAMGQNMADLDVSGWEKIRARAVGQPLATFTQQLRRHSSGSPPAFERIAVLCTRGSMSMSQLRELIASEYPVFRQLAEPGWRLLEFAAGHWPMFSDPRGLAELLHGL